MSEFDKILEMGANEDPIFKSESSVQEHFYQSTPNEELVINQLNLISDLFNLLNKEVSFVEFINQISLLLDRVLPSQRLSFLEFDHMNEYTFFRSCVGPFSNEIQASQIPVFNLHLRGLCEKGGVLLLTDAKRIADYFQNSKTKPHIEIKNLVLVPILIKNSAFGYFEFINRDKSVEYLAEDMNILTIASQYVSKLIENRLLFGMLTKEVFQEVA